MRVSIGFAALAAAAVLAAATAHAQQTEAADEAATEQAPAEPQALPDEVAQDFQQRLDEIRRQEALVADLDKRRKGAEGVTGAIYARRMDTIWSSMFENTLNLARDVAAQRDAGFEVERTARQLSRDLEVFPDQAIAAIGRLSEGIVIPTEDMEPAELVVRDRELIIAIERFDKVLESIHLYVDIAESMDIDTGEIREYLVERLSDGVANRSAYLALAIEEVSISRASAAVLAKDEYLASRVLAAEARVKSASIALQETVRLMDLVGLDTRQYRQQLLTATGQLTTDVLDVSVLGGLVADWSKALYDMTRTEGPRLLLQFLLFILVIWVSLRLRGLVKRLATRAMLAYDVKMSHLLKRMVVSTAGNLILLFGVLIALSQIGVSLGPLLAGLGIAGFIIGFALQDTLSNFASGMMILLYRPFDVGDVVEAGGVSGKVDRMSLVNTTFKTFDNQVLVVPNNLIWKTVITNLTDQTTRRVDLTFGIAYHDDIDKAKAILKEAAVGYETVLADPEPMIKVGALGESSVNLILRPWVKTDDYWSTYWDLTEIVKKRFDEEGITIPFPQRTVHKAADRL